MIDDGEHNHCHLQYQEIKDFHIIYINLVQRVTVTVKLYLEQMSRSAWRTKNSLKIVATSEGAQEDFPFILNQGQSRL